MFSGQLTTPDRFSYHSGLTMLQMFQWKPAYPQSTNFRGLPWDWFLFSWLTKSKIQGKRLNKSSENVAVCKNGGHTVKRAKTLKQMTNGYKTVAKNGARERPEISFRLMAKKDHQKFLVVNWVFRDLLIYFLKFNPALEDESTREKIGRPPCCTEPKKVKPSTLQTHSSAVYRVIFRNGFLLFSS